MKTQQEVREFLVSKAGSDQKFRNWLLAEPKAAVQDATGINIPERISVEVHQESSSDIHLILPSSEQMSIEEMEDIAGGNIYNFMY